MVTKKIGKTVAMVVAVGALGATGLASAAPSPARDISSERCPSLCPAIYEPVKCLMRNGSYRTFGNACEAAVYACKHPGQIISCGRA